MSTTNKKNDRLYVAIKREQNAKAFSTGLREKEEENKKKKKPNPKKISKAKAAKSKKTETKKTETPTPKKRKISSSTKKTETKKTETKKTETPTPKKRKISSSSSQEKQPPPLKKIKKTGSSRLSKEEGGGVISLYNSISDIQATALYGIILTNSVRDPITNCITCPQLTCKQGRPTIANRSQFTKSKEEHSKRRSFMASHIVLRFWKLEPKHEKDEASHICNNEACVHQDHIVWESGKDNRCRQFCNKYGTNIECPNCNNVILNCPHNPPCLMSKKGDGTHGVVIRKVK